jgi:hypothetical protein
VNIPLDVKENDEHSLDFSPVMLFSFLVSLNFPCTAYAFFPNACLITSRVSFAICPRFYTKSDAVPLPKP